MRKRMVDVLTSIGNDATLIHGPQCDVHVKEVRHDTPGNAGSVTSEGRDVDKASRPSVFLRADRFDTPLAPVYGGNMNGNRPPMKRQNPDEKILIA